MTLRERAWLWVADTAEAVETAAHRVWLYAIGRAAAAVEYEPIEHVGPDPWEAP